MSWWYRLWRRREMDEQLEKELRFHVDRHAADLMASGISPDEARRRARVAFGGAEQIREECRDARGTRWLEDLWQDISYAVRTLRHKPGFAAVALLTLALGTGATTVMFTVVNGVLLKPLPYAHPESLLALQEQTNWSTQWGNLWGFTYPNFVDCGRETRSLQMAAWRYGGGTLSRPGEPEYVDARAITSDLFPLLGVNVVAGRGFRADEDRPGAAPVVIISHGLWQRRFGAGASAIGQPIVFDGKPWTIVGAMPPGFRLDDDEVDLFTPLGQDTSPIMQNRQAHSLRVWARLRPGATLARAQAELAVVGRRLATQYPASNKGRTFVAEPLRPDVGDVRSTLWLLLAAVSLVLLIACANIASLLLARAVSRERELAMRVALGAGRGRLARQCLTESAVLGLCGGLLGIALAAIGVRPFVVFWPGSLPRADQVHVDWRVVLFGAGVSVASGILFGLAPAIRIPARQLESMLRAGSRTLAGGSRRLHGGFVIAEIALAVVLLVSAGMLGRTLLRLSSLDPGIDVHNVLTARMALSPATLASPARIRAAWQQVLEDARRVPGVEAVATVDTVPMRSGNNPIGYWTTPAEPPQSEQPLVLANSVSAEYLRVMRIPLREGRFFTGQDRIGSQPVVVIDDIMARQAFGSHEAIGQHIWFGFGPEPATVVGVVGHVRYWGLAGDDRAHIRAQMYYPFAQVPDRFQRRWSELMSIAVRTSIPPLNAIEPLRHAVQGPGGDQVVYEVNTMEHLARATLARQRFLLLLFGIFAGLALLLACVGIYGVLAYLNSQRVPEMGVRMALGANAGDVLWLVLKHSLRLIAAGTVLGIVAALGAGRVLERIVEGMQPTDPLTFSLMTIVLITAALAASYVPARRASRIDPMKALRQD